MTKNSTALKNETDVPPVGHKHVVLRNITELRFAHEAPEELGLQVRHSDDSEGLSTLEASIRAHGIIVPLVFKEHQGTCYVTAGNRRLKIARKIFEEQGSPLGGIAFAPTLNSDHFDGDPREIAMATNIALPPHPVDRYEVIAALVSEGMSPEDAMLRFGMTNRQYVQTMKLGTLAPELRDKWRSGEIDAAAAQALTLTDDTAEQIKIYNAIKKASAGSSGRIDAHLIKSRIVPESQRELGSLVEFLGVEELDKKGLIKQRDWFGNNHVVTDAKAIKKLAVSALDETANGLVNIRGWSWAVRAETENNTYAFGRLEPDKKGNFSTDQKAKSGCFVDIDRDGKLRIDYGRIKPGEAKKAERSKKDKTKPPASKDDGAVSRGLAFRLAGQLQRAGSEALKSNHAIAASAIIAAISSGGHVLNIQVGAMTSAKKPTSFMEVFAGALKATPQQREAMFAQIAAQALHIPGEAPLDDDAVSELFGVMTASNVSKLIAEEFDAKDYFASISHGAIMAICQACLKPDISVKVAKMKKPAAAKFATANVTGWLPKQLRTVHYKGPVESMTKGELTKLAKEVPAKMVSAKKKPVSQRGIKA